MNATSTDSLSNNDGENLEIFSLIWFDTNDRLDENYDIQQTLRKTINYIKLFHNMTDCVLYIRERSIYDRLYVIINKKFVEDMVPRVHNCQQVLAIYVYGLGDNSDEQSIAKYYKVGTFPSLLGFCDS